MRQKYLTFLLSVLMSMVGAKAFAYDFAAANVDGVTIYYIFYGNELGVTYRTTSGDSYTGRVVIPESVVYNGITYKVQRIARNAFLYCTGLTEVIIPNSVTSIKSRAFYGCTNLTSVTIPNNVIDIVEAAFGNCPNLISVTSLNTAPPVFRVDNYTSAAFDPITEQNATLHVPAGCKEAYQKAEHWKDFLNIQDDASTGIDSVNADKQGKNTVYTIDGKQLNTTNVSDLPTGIYIINGKKVVVK